MNGCPHHQPPPRDGLPPLIPRIAALPRDERGYPIPFFVATLEDGTRDFRIMSQLAWAACHNERRCWTCGQPLGQFATFVIGPMCTINRTTAEPPSHRDCAEWSVQGCPFLSRPNMTRRDGGEKDSHLGNVAGQAILRNPGVSCLWTVKASPARPRGYIIFRDPAGKPLIEIGKPDSVTWWREGRTASRAEVLESIESGLPFLQKACDAEQLATERDAAHLELVQKTAVAMQYLPPKEEKRLIITL